MNETARYFRIAGLTIRVEADLPFHENTFHPKLKAFEVDGPGEDNAVLRHRFSLPPVDVATLGKKIYQREPWAVFEKEDAWTYLGVLSNSDLSGLHKVASFSRDYGQGVIHHQDPAAFLRGNSIALTFFPTDQIYVGPLMAAREGFYLHSSGVIFGGRGFLFVGHSEAGKSTMVKMLKGKAEILCDDRIIVKKEKTGFRIHGTWSHGEVPDVSPSSAPLDAVFFLRKSDENVIRPMARKEDAARGLLCCLIKPLTPASWWEKMLDLVDGMRKAAPCYELHFDKSGRIADILEEFSVKMNP